MYDVHTSYNLTGEPFDFSPDEKAHKAVGRHSDFSGTWLEHPYQRDLGWGCKTKAEAQKIKRALQKIGMPATTNLVRHE